MLYSPNQIPILPTISPPLRSLDLVVLWHITAGRTDQQIADATNYSKNYIKDIVAALMERVGVNRRTGLALYALRAGIVRLDQVHIQNYLRPSKTRSKTQNDIHTNP